MQIIAEAKTKSPFGWESDKNWDELFNIATKIGDVISVHTNPHWNGSFELISKARSRTDKPILAKGIHRSDRDIVRALNAGADYVLVVGRVPEVHLDKCLIEPRSIDELATLPPELKAVWNSRDLSTGELKSESFSEAREIFTGWLCQASNIIDVSDIHPAADAVLVGSHLPEFAQSMGT